MLFLITKECNASFARPNNRLVDEILPNICSSSTMVQFLFIHLLNYWSQTNTHSIWMVASCQVHVWHAVARERASSIQAGCWVEDRAELMSLCDSSIPASPPLSHCCCLAQRAAAMPPANPHTPYINITEYYGLSTSWHFQSMHDFMSTSEDNT